jgi:hypothetical protein
MRMLQERTQTVMPGFMPGIHAIVTHQSRGWPAFAGHDEKRDFT